MKKYELIESDFVKLLTGKRAYRIKRISTGEIGGFIESEKNLAHDGDAWVYGAAQVSGDARVKDSRCYITISPLGSRNSALTGFMDGNTLRFSTGCYSGDENEFLAAVKEKHGGTSLGKEYVMAVELIKLRFGK